MRNAYARFGMFVLLAGALAAAGCGRNVGYVVKPVPLSDELRESVVASDMGWFVSDKIALVEIDGLLMNQRDAGLFQSGENPVALFVQKLNKAQADDGVRALILRINSPGGGVTASDIMYRRLVQFRRARPKVPVVALIEDVGASGAYYVACGADAIVAHPSSITGSIGVIVQTVSLAGTMKMIGVDAKAVTSGQFKDMASPFKPLDEKDLAILQTIVNEYYAQFVQVVAGGRKKLSEDKVRALADGRVYTGPQALDNGLVDAVGDMRDALSMAKTRAGVSRAKVVMYHPSWGNPQNVYSAAPNPPVQLNLVNVNVPSLLALTQPRFLYLWTGRN